ncbi:hypothetical protein L484_000592 [Morus notabilis]|uniref:Uncharacterized protein n=1 Tax=Morus notabilis TaxID=981085 RepID=W9R6E8_9ROSA|nr:hypothetical protein L484_000592 [Morus notabilis]
MLDNFVGFMKCQRNPLSLHFERTEIVHALEELNYDERRLRRNMVQIRKEQDIFVLFLDEPHFANNTTHQGKPATKSCLSREELVKHKLHFRVRHGAASLAEEKQLFREIKDAGQHYEDVANSCLLVEEINGSFYREMRCEKTHRKTTKDRLGDIMTWPRKENVAEAIVLGNICNSLSLNRKSVREQLKVRTNN